MNKVVEYLLYSKQNQLWMSVNLSLRGVISDFRNKLRGYFSNQQKEVMKNVKSDNFSNFYDKDKYIQKLSNLYAELSIKIFNKAIDRVKKEVDVEGIDDDLIKYIIKKYVSLTITDIVNNVERTTYKTLNRYLNKNIEEYGEINKDELIKKVNEYYNNDCKGRRSLEIARTETYRCYNFGYLSLMVSYGYHWKKWIAKNAGKKDSLGARLHNQVKFYLEDFVVIDEKGKFSVQHPPLHPWNEDIIIALREV